MKREYCFFFILSNLMSACWGNTRFLAIPLDNIELLDYLENGKMPVIRTPRHISTSKVQKLDRYFQGQPEAQSSSHFEQASFNPQEYVDYGAHTGHHGAFGWYADFPVRKDN